MLCLITPISLAYQSFDQSTAQFAFDVSLNVSLFFDMIINFLSAYYDSNINIIDQPKVSEI
jgi:hypothetical protein